MISAQISPEHPEHGGLLRTIFDYYVEIPLDRLLKARKEIWQQPHEEAFRELEARLSGARLDAERRHPYLSKLDLLLFSFQSSHAAACQQSHGHAPQKLFP